MMATKWKHHRYIVVTARLRDEANALWGEYIDKDGAGHLTFTTPEGSTTDGEPTHYVATVTLTDEQLEVWRGPVFAAFRQRRGVRVMRITNRRKTREKVDAERALRRRVRSRMAGDAA